MGALTGPVYFHGVRVASGDVVRLAPRGLLRLLRRPFSAVVDTRDRSAPYLVYCRRRDVLKVPLEGAFPEKRYSATVYRLPGIDKARASVVAARAAERPGEGVHHPAFECGRRLRDPGDLVPDAYAAIGVRVRMEGSAPGVPLQPVRSEHDPPHDLFPPDPEGGGGTGARFVERGVEKTLPWQKRSRR